MQPKQNDNQMQGQPKQGDEYDEIPAADSRNQTSAPEQAKSSDQTGDSSRQDGSGERDSTPSLAQGATSIYSSKVDPERVVVEYEGTTETFYQDGTKEKEIKKLRANVLREDAGPLIDILANGRRERPALSDGLSSPMLPSPSQTMAEDGGIPDNQEDSDDE